jgi:hypothetical protein
MLTAERLYRLSRIAVVGAALMWAMPATMHGQAAQTATRPGGRGGAGQAAEGAAKPAAEGQGKPYVVPRTPWGDPDFQGVWQHSDAPAQAESTLPPEFGDRLVAARKSRYAENDRRGQQTSQLSKEKPLIVDPADGHFPLLPGKFFFYDPVARGDTWDNHFVRERCITSGIPDEYLRGDDERIVQSPGWVVILSEFIHDVRSIPVDGRPHLGENIRFWNGDPRGHFEGDTLVVETTNFNDKGQLFAELGGGIKQTSHMKVVERWTRTDEKTIRHEFTVSDPDVFTRPFTAVQTHKIAPPNFFVVEYACNEGNFHYMSGTLLQGRIRDQEGMNKGTSEVKGTSEQKATSPNTRTSASKP